VRLKGLHVLGSQPRDEDAPQVGAQGLKLRACDCEGDPRAEMAYAAHVKVYRPVPGDAVMKGMLDLFDVFAWQPVEYRQMCAQNVSAWGEMLLAKTIERFQIVRIDARS
jgi:hypothetical protein